MTKTKKTTTPLVMAAILFIAAAMPVSAAGTGVPHFVKRIASMQTPQFPDRQLSIAETGARQRRLSTAAIQKAIDRLHAKGGGTVIVPEGHWLTGRIELKSNINLHISEGAALEFSGSVKDYLPVVKTRSEGADIMSLGAMIYACGQENIAVTGKGVVLAPDTLCEIYRKRDRGVTAENEERMARSNVFDGTDGIVYMPTFIGPIGCQDILIEGITLNRSVFWNIAPVYCKGITIRGVTVNSHGHGRTDGIDIDSSTDVLIENTTLDCGDDCFALKSGRGLEAARLARPTENVVIRNCRVKRGSGGVAIGSETAGMIRNVYVDNITMESPAHAIYIKTRRPRGGGCDSIFISNIKVEAAGSSAIDIGMLGSRKWVGELADRLPPRKVNELTPHFSNIFIDGLAVGSCKSLLSVCGLPESQVENLVIRNVKSDNKNMKMHDVGKFEITFAK